MKRIKHAISKKISLEMVRSLQPDEIEFLRKETRRLHVQLKKEATQKSRIIVKREITFRYDGNDFVENMQTLLAEVYTVKGPRIIGKGKVFKCQRPGYRPYAKRPKTHLQKMVVAMRAILKLKAMAMEAYTQHIENVLNKIKPIPKYPPGGVVSPGGPALIGQGDHPRMHNFHFDLPTGFGLDLAKGPSKTVWSLHEFHQATNIIRRVTDNFRIGYSWEFDDKPMPEPPATTKFTIRFTPPINFLAIVKVFLAKHPDAWHPFFYRIHCMYHTIMLMRHEKRRMGIISI